MTDIYAAHAHDYRKKGYSPLPLPANKKAPVPNGWTGSEGLFASGADVQEWCDSNPKGNIALRVPRNVIGIDVDDYGTKSGAQSVKDAVAQFGTLPSTGRITSRYEQDKVSGIRLFLVPEGTVLAAQFSSAGLGPDVEIVQFHHRYCVAPGSIHPDTGLPYKWINRDGTEGELPAVEDLPELPQAWIDGLQPKGRSERPATDVNHAAYDAMDESTQNQVQAYMEKTLAGIYGDLEAMKSWPEEYRNERGEGWEEGVLQKTFRLAQLVNADWNTLTTDEVLRDLKKACPRGPGFEIQKSLGKFVRALPNAEAAHYTITPRSEEYDMLGDVEDRTPGKAGGDDVADESVAPTAHGDTQFSIDFSMKGCYRLDDDGKPKGIKPYSTAEKLLASWPVAKQALTRGRSWWAYRDGVWMPNDEIVRLSLARSARDNYKTADVAPVEDSLATMVPEIVVEPHPEFINFRNGMLEWRTGQLHEHSPEYHSTVQIPHSWDASATCPEFDAWLDQRLPAAGVQLAWELIAVSLYSGNPIQRAGLLYGVGKSGKSTYLEVVQGLIGKKNYAALSPHGMTKTVFATHALLGKQSNIVTDIDPTKIAETAIFKQVVASEAIQAQQKNKPEFTFQPFANHLFSANQIPKTADRTSAWTRRFAILRFHHVIGAEVSRIIENYHKVLLREADGIIAKAIRKLPDLLKQGDFSVIEADQQEFEEATDFTSQFWDEAVTVTGNAGDFASKAQLATAFDMWCTSNRRRNPPPFDDLEPRLKDDPLCERKKKRLGGRSTNPVWGYTGVVIHEGFKVVNTLDLLMPDAGDDPF